MGYPERRKQRDCVKNLDWFHEIFQCCPLVASLGRTFCRTVRFLAIFDKGGRQRFISIRTPTTWIHLSATSIRRPCGKLLDESWERVYWSCRHDKRPNAIRNQQPRVLSGPGATGSLIGKPTLTIPS